MGHVSFFEPDNAISVRFELLVVVGNLIGARRGICGDESRDVCVSFVDNRVANGVAGRVAFTVLSGISFIAIGTAVGFDGFSAAASCADVTRRLVDTDNFILCVIVIGGTGSGVDGFSS